MDFLACVGRRPGLFGLDSVTAIMQPLLHVLANKHEEYQLVALQSLQTITKQYDGPTLAGLQTPPASGFMDLAAEDRAAKAARVMDALREAQNALGQLKRSTGKVGALARAVGTAIDQVVASDE